uniref:NADH-ubiquinone oxidoreductase chain 6 n=1 Tax=Valentia hoffmanni TaxID=575843 RepID=C5HIY8_9HEMI|nr:NADH dehydrogenase subunit 6 [Valentia hoffmanni]ACJ69583.1 NADH dehydrogenase subunit 6 [Valentia hoffmanni]
MSQMMNLSLLMSILLPMTKHPLSMGMILIMQTIIIATITGLMINTFWFSYILIITMLSGMLVLFIYMASIASNEKFQTSMNMMIMTSMMTITAILTPFLGDQLSQSKNWSSSKKATLLMDQSMNMIKLFNIHNLSITMLIICYLFFTMIVVSFIVNNYEGPLRTKN